MEHLDTRPAICHVRAARMSHCPLDESMLQGCLKRDAHVKFTMNGFQFHEQGPS